MDTFNNNHISSYLFRAVQIELLRLAIRFRALDNAIYTL